MINRKEAFVVFALGRIEGRFVCLLQKGFAMNALEKEKKSKLSKAQLLPILLCWLVYVSAYLGRYSYAANISVVIDTFGVSRADAGLVSTFFFFAYGVGQVVNGILSKYYPKRVIIPAALFVSAAVNLAVFLGAPFGALKFLWLFNGIAQSIFWPNLVSSLSESLKPYALSKAILAMSSTVAVGTFASYGASALFSTWGGFTYSFLLGASVMLVTAVLWATLYGRAFKKVPAEASAETLGTERAQALAEKPKGFPRELLAFVLALGSFAVINNLVKDGLTTWMPRFLKEAFGLPDSLSMILTLVLPVVGFFGAACATTVHKKIPAFVTHAGLWFLLTLLLILGCVLLLDSTLWWLMLVLFGLVSLAMHAINNIITSMAPLYLREKINAGLLAGVLNGCCYVGSTMSSYGLGVIADAFSWRGVFLVLLFACLIPIAVGTLSTLSDIRKKKRN